MLGERLLEMFLNLEWQPMLQQAGDFLAVVSVAIAHGEKVAMTEIEHVWIRQVGILVHFVRIVLRDTSLRRE